MLCVVRFFFFLCKQKTAYEMRISDWSSDVCSSDLVASPRPAAWPGSGRRARAGIVRLATALSFPERSAARLAAATATAQAGRMRDRLPSSPALAGCYGNPLRQVRSEERWVRKEGCGSGRTRGWSEYEK